MAKSAIGILMSRIKWAIIAAVLFVGALEFADSKTPPPLTAMFKQGCTIKGKVHLLKGERFYYTRQDPIYPDRTVSPIKEGKWFCSTKEAEAEGWKPYDPQADVPRENLLDSL
ncbi:MAG: hypothetical protein HC796_08295 [Synechococcaceae cyanobacterium RL_1_2]|nr:hypothetical protein [Synechococcaceae cyanobacterium RL_1_2]